MSENVNDLNADVEIQQNIDTALVPSEVLRKHCSCETKYSDESVGDGYGLTYCSPMWIQNQQLVDLNKAGNNTRYLSIIPDLSDDEFCAVKQKVTTNQYNPQKISEFPTHRDADDPSKNRVVAFIYGSAHPDILRGIDYYLRLYQYTEPGLTMGEFLHLHALVGKSKDELDKLRDTITKEIEKTNKDGGTITAADSADDLGDVTDVKGPLKESDDLFGGAYDAEEAEPAPDMYEEPSEPTEDDIVSDDPGGPFYYHRKRIAENREELKEWMNKQGYFPNVWWISDHGNAHLITDIHEWRQTNMRVVVEGVGLEEPNEGDVIAQGRYGPFYYKGRMIARDWSELTKWMEARNLFPNVWRRAVNPNTKSYGMTGLRSDNVVARGPNGPFFYRGKKIADTHDELRQWMQANKYSPETWQVAKVRPVAESRSVCIPKSVMDAIETAEEEGVDTTDWQTFNDWCYTNHLFDAYNWVSSNEARYMQGKAYGFELDESKPRFADTQNIDALVEELIDREVE